ncbi:glycosyltransferase family 9 protein [Acetobacter sp.]|uniref:glycosyltransferase family 9 protein n=1 Tax=Acetobacter sp. TaxID=440 RepID=UPI0039E9733F
MSDARPSTPQSSVNLGTDLSRVKINRQQSYANQNSSRFIRIARRLRNLKARHSWRSLPLKIARRLISIACIKIVGNRKAANVLSNFTELQAQRDIDTLTLTILKKIKNGELGKLHVYAVYITGGLGDALICARMVRDLQKHLGNTLFFDVYCPSPQISEEFFKNIPNFRQCINPDIFHDVKSYYIFSIVANQFATFVNEAIDYRSLLTYCPEVLNVFGTAQKKRQKIERFIVNHPFLDGAFADIAVRAGHKRYKYLHDMLGLTYNGDELTIDTDPNLPLSFGLKPNTYITVHDGWDGNFKITTQRPTKAVPIEKWTQIISGLKQALPNMMIVQIGGPVGAILPGVDLNLKKKLSFSESTSILAQSALHVDAETGLVHLVAALGVKSVVMFGPTNVDWFGYPQNANIRPHQCGNCWWSTDTWMASCPLDLPIPACTNNINPDEVVSAAVRLLELPQTDTKQSVTA